MGGGGPFCAKTKNFNKILKMLNKIFENKIEKSFGVSGYLLLVVLLAREMSTNSCLIYL
jgi:hypothetical protein